MATGTVRTWKADRGFGFITPDDGSADVFVHFSGIESNGPGQRNLTEGQRVEFDVEPGRKGEQAANVRGI